MEAGNGSALKVAVSKLSLKRVLGDGLALNQQESDELGDDQVRGGVQVAGFRLCVLKWFKWVVCDGLVFHWQ